jgi:hypothetical protein
LGGGRPLPRAEGPGWISVDVAPGRLTSPGDQVRDILGRRAARQVAWKLGYSDLSSLTTDRIEWAARESSVPLAVADSQHARDAHIPGIEQVPPLRAVAI